MTDYDQIRQRMELLNDGELAKILREHDEEQWRPEVFDIVRAILNARGVSLSTVMATEEYAPDDIAGLDLVTVAGYFSRLDAEADRAALHAKGLKSWIAHTTTSGAEDAGIALQVLAEDFAAALAALESELAPSTDLPPELAGPPCPKCGSGRVTEKIETVEEMTNSGKTISKEMWFCQCASCGRRWSESR